MTHEQADQATPAAELAEQQREESIEELLLRYYEAHGTNPAYEVERSITIDGHEVAWLRYQGQVQYDITGRGREGQPYEGHALHCACHFKEGVGWEMDERFGGPVGLTAGDGCAKKEAALYLRRLELRRSYEERGMLDDLKRYEPETIKAIMLDLIAKREADEFVEATNGAEFWGGHYYLQTVAEVLDVPMEYIWKATHQLQAEKRIRLEGMVVQTYREPYKALTYEPQAAPEAVLHHERPDKVWAMVPRPEEAELDLAAVEITDENRWSVLGRCVVGLAHTAELAKARLEEALANPRLSHDRLYQQSFVEASYHAGALAVIAYSARTSDQPEEWVVEGFLGDALTPEEHRLPMDYPTIFGIDGADQSNLSAKLEGWWSADK